MVRTLGADGLFQGRRARPKRLSQGRHPWITPTSSPAPRKDRSDPSRRPAGHRDDCRDRSHAARTGDALRDDLLPPGPPSPAARPMPRPRLTGDAARGRARRGERPLLRGTRLDLAASGVFASGRAGSRCRTSPVLLAFRDMNRALPAWIALAVGLALLARGVASPGRTANLPRPSAVLVVLGTYALAPLGVVHLLKNTFGRARPLDIVAFGGDDVFTAVWQVSEACTRNCSFASARPRRLPCCRSWCCFCHAGGGRRRSSSSCPSRSPPREPDGLRQPFPLRRARLLAAPSRSGRR